MLKSANNHTKKYKGSKLQKELLLTEIYYLVDNLCQIIDEFVKEQKNTSNIDKKPMMMYTDKFDIFAQPDNTSNMDYIKNYNCLRIMSGLGGLTYAN
jgi:hypothetical protein